MIVTPASDKVRTGNLFQLAATGVYSDGSTQNVTSFASWSSSATTIATVNAGLLTGIAAGTVTITAATGGVTSSAVTVQVGTPADFYVATNGNASWSATLFTPNSPNTDHPFAPLPTPQSAVTRFLP